MALIASLPSLASQVVAVLTNSAAMQTFSTLLDSLHQDSTVEDLLRLLEDAGISLSNYVPMAGTGLLSWLVSPFLTLGLLNYFFLLLRGEKDAPISTVFSRTGCFFKGIGLNLLTSLRTLLWMLPGLALSALGAVLLMFTDSFSLATALVYAGSIGMLVLGIRAALHYAMATRVMAECPEKGISQCIRESIAIMRRRKMLLISLELSFILLSLLISLAEGLLTELLGAVLGATLSMALSFALNIYMQMAGSTFYAAYRAQAEI